jgi:glycosyltransferase involved in cell wall biosynthesis
MSTVDESESSSAHRQHKILMLNENDESGGAARAAIRLATGLRRRGADLRMAVQRKDGDRYWIVRGESKKQKLLSRSMGYIDRLPNVVYPERGKADWSNNWFPNDIGKVFEFDRYDLLHLHWMGGGFLPMRTLAKINLPMVWTLHDMWSFTGGCHYSGDCNHFQDACGSCPQLGSRTVNDLSARNLRAKRHAFERKKVQIVSPSNWLAEAARKSSLFRQFDISVIPYGIDPKAFRPIDRRTARDVLGLPQDARIALFGAVNATRDDRKGFSLLCSAIGELARDGARADNMQLVVFGSSEPRDPPELGIPVRFLGKLSDDASLACLYSSADVLVLPSRQENLANAVIEAMACGTPAVAFDIGGNSDLVEHMKTGYLVKPFDTSDLAAGISWLLGDRDRLKAISEAVRRECERKYDLDVVCAQYEDVYRKAVAACERSI